MPRNQRRKSIEAELPTGTQFKLRLPDSVIARKAIQLIPDSVSENKAATGQHAMANQLRLCLEELDGDAVTFEDLRFAGLDSRLSPKEQTLLENVFQKATQPKSAEMERFRSSIEQYRDGSDWCWRGEILTGPGFTELKDAERELEEARHTVRRLKRELDGETDDEEESAKVDALSEAKQTVHNLEAECEELREAGVEVEGVLLNSKIKRRSAEQLPPDLQEPQALALKEVQDNLLRNVITSIDGTAVSYSDLAGTGLDDWLSPKEQHCVLMAVGEFSGLEEEDQDFLDDIDVA